LRLELKLIADIGLVGLPNAGKSSILAAISGASPKIADYPFTTLSPNLGILFTDVEAVILADIPGLIEGASKDKGLGLSFLRHIERTRLLLHILDISSGEPDAVKREWRIVRDEMGIYDQELNGRPCIVVGNKMDLCAAIPDFPAFKDELENFFRGQNHDFFVTSALSGENIDCLTEEIVSFAKEHPRPRGDVRLFASIPADETNLDRSKKRSRRKVQIVSLPGGSFRVLHTQLEHAAEVYDFSQPENMARFTRLLRKNRVEELLSAAGAVPGASVSIGRIDFDFYPDCIEALDKDCSVS
jgi:GTP-binding protein